MQKEALRMEMVTIQYDNKIVRNFAVATMLWGAVGMLVGLLIAIQMFEPALNARLQFLTFGRLRPLHTNAVIFAFVGNGIFMGLYYSLQRLCKARMFSDLLSNIHFWGWQAIIVAAAVTLPLGLTTGKEYAELEWPIDIAITLIWVVLAINVLGTVIRRREKHMYVAIWFYIATLVTVAVLHIVNSIEIPVSLLKSYPVYAGVQDALVQWWYGHNAVAFFLTTPYLGLMYYFLPKAANRPVYSYRLSIIHFWSLIFLYIWAGPHHLLYTALPDWAQSLGTVFSIMLLAPSWGGAINGLLTLRGAWDKVREDAVLKFMAVAITAYGMATFEGPLLSLKNVNAISHYTDWTISHVHIGAMGWNGFLTFGILYWLVPKMWNTTLYSRKLANLHFWIGTLGIVVYASSMYWAGITQSLMWKQFTGFGVLQYPNFLETVTQILPFYAIRALGGCLYLIGVLVMVYNLVRTARHGKLTGEEEVQVPARWDETSHGRENRHRWLEKRPIQFALLATVAILIGGIVEMIPTFLVATNIPTIASVKPYTPLELEGRDIYVREGCYTCHSQMIRPFRSETERYGDYSKAGEFVYDHPFQWGSKRTGPDLHRVGKKFPNLWHFMHMDDPRSVSPGSIMPAYPWLYTQDIDTTVIAGKIRAMQSLGVPYPKEYDRQALTDMRAQAEGIALDLQKQNAPGDPTKEIIALIAYMQRLGTDIAVPQE
jgi:cytochrome c oxidase cbb3-type subunit I/II